MIAACRRAVARVEVAAPRASAGSASRTPRRCEKMLRAAPDAGQFGWVKSSGRPAAAVHSSSLSVCSRLDRRTSSGRLRRRRPPRRPCRSSRRNGPACRRCRRSRRTRPCAGRGSRARRRCCAAHSGRGERDDQVGGHRRRRRSVPSKARHEVVAVRARTAGRASRRRRWPGSEVGRWCGAAAAAGRNGGESEGRGRGGGDERFGGDGTSERPFEGRLWLESPRAGSRTLATHTNPAPRPRRR